MARKRFKLEIEMENAAAQTPQDIAQMLDDLAQRFRSTYALALGARGNLRDSNGNSVGKWSVYTSRTGNRLVEN